MVLAGNPPCSDCGAPGANTVDHIIEWAVSRDNSLSNLRPLCKPCNSRKGAQFVNARRAAQKREQPVRGRPQARQAPRRAPQGGGGVVFGRAEQYPGALSPLSLAETPEIAPETHDSPQSLRMRWAVPRLETAHYGGLSHGPAVAELAERVLGQPLMAWQVRVLSGQLEHEDGNPAALRRRFSLVSVARQNGKSYALRCLVLYWLTVMPQVRGEPQKVLTTAHRLDLASSLFTSLAPVLVDQFGATAKRSYGRQELTMPDGSMWLVQSASPMSGHGHSLDLVCVDELFGVGEDALDQGFIPAQRARRSPLLSMWSTAGTEASHAFLRWRQQGLAAVDAGGAGPLYMGEYSPPPGCDPDDETVWPYANPGLAEPDFPLTLDSMRIDHQSPNRAAFLRGNLNLWVAAENSWLQPGLWEQLRWGDDAPPATVLAVDSSPDESRYVGVRAGLDPDTGVCVVSVAFQCSTMSEMWAQVEQQLPPRAVLAVTPMLESHAPLAVKQRTAVVGYRELTQWTALVKGLLSEGRVYHTGEQSLADHMARAVAARTQQGLVLSSQRSPGPIELARCAVWAIALATKSRWASRPAIGIARSR